MREQEREKGGERKKWMGGCGSWFFPLLPLSLSSLSSVLPLPLLSSLPFDRSPSSPAPA